MTDRVDEIIVRGIRLASAKRKHFRAASEWWIKASKFANRRAIRLLARVMLNAIHGGRTEQRPIVLAALKSASLLDRRWKRRYLLFAWATGPRLGIKDSFVRLAQSGDVVAPLALGRCMADARASMDYGYVVQAYGFLVQSFVEWRNVAAARLIAGQLQTDGHLFQALSLLVWAGNRGDFTSLTLASGIARDLGLGLAMSGSERDSAFALARHKAFVCRDPGAAVWLSLCFAEPDLGLVLDIVACIRMSRLAGVVDADLNIPPVFGGETLRRISQGNRVAGFDLLYEEQMTSSQLFHFWLVPLTTIN